jgi:hypothetical protein
MPFSLKNGVGLWWATSRGAILKKNIRRKKEE